MAAIARPPFAPVALPLSALLPLSTSTSTLLSLSTSPPLFPSEAVFPPLIAPLVAEPVETEVPLPFDWLAPWTPELALPPSPLVALASLLLPPVEVAFPPALQPDCETIADWIDDWMFELRSPGLCPLHGLPSFAKAAEGKANASMKPARAMNFRDKVFTPFVSSE